ncbi:MAG: hypothetical protein ACI93R_000418 [Flavobacteriales bacterium]|jgi:hypothetical protein
MHVNSIKKMRKVFLHEFIIANISSINTLLSTRAGKDNMSCHKNVSFILLVLCLSLSVQPFAYGFGKSKAPGWVLNQIPDTDQVFYGIGGGGSLEAAKQGALEDIAGKLLTQVQSSSEYNSVASNDKVSEQFSSNIKTSVSNMGLSGYSVDLSKKKGKMYWIRISLEKSALFSSTAAQLEPVLLELNQTFSHIDSKSVLQIKKNADHLRRLIKDSKGKLFVMSSAQRSYNASPPQQILSSYESRLSDKLKGLVLYLKADKQLAELGTKIAHELNLNGWTATTRRPSAGFVTIQLNGVFKDGIQFGNKFSAAPLSIEVLDEFNKMIAQQQFHIHGTSRSSYENARQIAATKFVDELKLEGVGKKLGLEN